MLLKNMPRRNVKEMWEQQIERIGELSYVNDVVVINVNVVAVVAVVVVAFIFVIVVVVVEIPCRLATLFRYLP